MKITAGFIPQLKQDEIHYVTKKIGGLEIEVPQLTNDQLQTVITSIKKSSADMRQQLTVMELVEIIDQAIERLLDRENHYRKMAEQILPLTTGYDKEMIRLGLTSYLKIFRKPQLLQFLTEDFTNPLILDDFQPRTKGGYAKAIAPAMLTHIWAGNVPALPLWSLISSLLVKSGSLGKVATAEPLFASWFAQLIAEIEPRLAPCLAIVWWQGGDREKESFVLAQSDVVVAYGSNESIQSLKEQTPITTKFLSYGHKIGFGFIAKDSLNAYNAKETAYLAAYDTMRYDQQGCYSPHIFFVERGGNVTPKQFSSYVAAELDSFEKRYKRRILSFDEETSLSTWKQEEQFTTFTNEDKEIFSCQDGHWTVVFERFNHVIEPSPLNRIIRIIEVDSLTDVLQTLEEIRPYLQTAGLAAPPKKLFQLSTKLAEIGMTRITALGQMTAPAQGWHHDGSWNLLDLIRVVDIEASAERYADTVAPYRD